MAETELQSLKYKKQRNLGTVLKSLQFKDLKNLGTSSSKSDMSIVFILIVVAFFILKYILKRFSKPSSSYLPYSRY